ncbi:MAG: UrcA family protein [Hellea sp.]|nr:UrcA family protein [Hellea sp.]
MFTKTILTFTTLALAGTAISSPASATIVKGERVETSITATDLATEDGIARVYTQLAKTAAAKCGVDDWQTLSDRRVAAACAARLLTDFVQSVGHEQLTQLHSAKKSG